MDFIKIFSDKDWDHLRNNTFYINCLLPDIKKGIVFPSFRNDRVTFYHSGGGLCFYRKKQFGTHFKYASVLNFKKMNEYIVQDDLLDATPIRTFEEGYKTMKELCFHYQKLEAIGVSEIYKRFSFIENKGIVVIDIEVTFETVNKEYDLEPSGNKKHDRIDLLLFNTETKELRFYEVKHFSNEESRSKAGKKPSVIGQIERYTKQIKSKKDQILQHYQAYVKILNKRFTINLPIPEFLNEYAAYLLFGYDSYQNQKTKKFLIDDDSLEGIYFYKIGDIQKVNTKNLWEGTKKY
jgi:hypothetical protein